MSFITNILSSKLETLLSIILVDNCRKDTVVLSYMVVTSVSQKFVVNTTVIHYCVYDKFL